MIEKLLLKHLWAKLRGGRYLKERGPRWVGTNLIIGQNTKKRLDLFSFLQLRQAHFSGGLCVISDSEWLALKTALPRTPWLQYGIDSQHAKPFFTKRSEDEKALDRIDTAHLQLMVDVYEHMREMNREQKWSIHGCGHLAPYLDIRLNCLKELIRIFPKRGCIATDRPFSRTWVADLYNACTDADAKERFLIISDRIGFKPDGTGGLSGSAFHPEDWEWFALELNTISGLLRDLSLSAEEMKTMAENHSSAWIIPDQVNEIEKSVISSVLSRTIKLIHLDIFNHNIPHVREVISENFPIYIDAEHCISWRIFAEISHASWNRNNALFFCVRDMDAAEDISEFRRISDEGVRELCIDSVRRDYGYLFVKAPHNHTLPQTVYIN